MFVLFFACGLSNNIYMLNLTIMDLTSAIFIVPFVLNYLLYMHLNYRFLVISDTIYKFGLERTASAYGLYLCGLLHGCGSSAYCLCLCGLLHGCGSPLSAHETEAPRYRTASCALVLGLA